MLQLIFNKFLIDITIIIDILKLLVFIFYLSFSRSHDIHILSSINGKNNYVILKLPKKLFTYISLLVEALNK